MAASAQADLLPPEFTPAEPVTSSRKKTDPEELFASQCRAYRLPAVEQQYRFAKAVGRQWRFDFAFPEYHLAVEIEGLIVMRVWTAKLIGGGPIAANGRVVNVSEVKPTTVTMGRHATITGMRGDIEKYNSALLMGWSVLRFMQTEIKTRAAIETTMRALASRGWKGPQT